MSAGTRVCVVGLGAMGLPMAQTLASAGLTVSGFDPSAERRACLAGAAETVEEALAPLAPGDAVVLSLPNDAVVEAVTGALAVPAGTVVIDTSTIAPETARRVQADLAARGVGYVDAPVSGGPAGAAGGSLLMMVGGEEAAITAASPVLDVLGRLVLRCGGPGAGATVKLANNLLCAGHLLLAGEALRLATAGGVAHETLAEALNAGSGRSAVSEVNFPKWIFSGAFDSGFTLALMAKDVRLAKDLPGAGPIAAEIAGRWAEAAERLGGAEDFNRIVTDPEGGAR